MNPDCPVCSAEGADLAACKGTVPAEPACTCTTLCAEGAVNPDCPVCSAEGADLTACKGSAPMLLGAPIILPTGGTIAAGSTVEDIQNIFAGVHITVSGSTITLGNDVEVTGSVIFEGADWTLDLNGCTLSGGIGKTPLQVSGGSLTVQDSGNGGTIRGGPFGAGAICGDGIRISGGALMVRSGTIIGGNNSSEGGRRGNGIYVTGGTVTVEGGTITAGPKSLDNAGVFIDKGGTVFINGGTVKGSSDDDTRSCGVHIVGNGTAVISNGTLVGTKVGTKL